MTQRQRQAALTGATAPRRLAAVLAITALAVGIALAAFGCSSTASDGEATADAAEAQPAASPDEQSDTGEGSPSITVAITAAAPAASDGPIIDLKVEQIPSGPRESTPSALRDGINAPLLPEPLVSPLDILSGGVPPDGIPSIDVPSFGRASEVEWLHPQEAVVTVALNGDARAYPTQVMILHEIVNDTVGGEAVTVTYCPLCNTAVGYYRQLDGRVLEFGTSGRLYNSALVMYDRQTESLWAHYTGQAIAGALTGSQLELIPVATVAFETFQAEHPNGLVLQRPGGFGRSYGVNPYQGYDDPDGVPVFFGGTPDPRLPPMTRVLVIRHADAASAMPLDALESAGVVTADVGGRQVTAFHLPGTASPIQSQQVAFGRDVGATAVYDPTVDGQVLTFVRLPDASSSAGPGAFTDDQTGSTWTLLGRALDGPLAGTQLEPVEHLDTFWFAAAAYNPAIDLIDAP